MTSRDFGTANGVDAVAWVLPGSQRVVFWTLDLQLNGVEVVKPLGRA